jgi:hypothetical protein
MKRAIYLESYEIETVAQALEGCAQSAESLANKVVVRTGKRELTRLAKRLRDLLAPKESK